MTAIRHRRLLAAAALAASALALTGCAQLPALAFPTVEQRPAHPLTTKTFLPTISGAQNKARTVHASITAQSSKKTLTIQMDEEMTAGGLSLKETATQTGQPEVDVVLTGGKLYLKSAKLSRGAWQTIDLKAVAQQLGSEAKSLGLDSTSIAQANAALTKAIAYVQPSGQPVVLDGVQTMPYVVAIDTAQAPEFLGALATVADQLPAQLDYDWWIGADGLPRRYTVIASGISEDVRFTKWNQPVTITAPVGAPATNAPTTTASAAVDLTGGGDG